MKKMIIVAMLFSLFSVMSYAEVPNEIRYNGRLKSYQTPFTGQREMIFRIYDVATGGTPIWATDKQSITINNGIFSYTLSPDPSRVDWRKNNLYLEIVVNGKELYPREKLMAQPYALHSDSAENLTSNNEMNVQVGANAGKIGVNASGEVYSKSSAAGFTEFYMVPKGGIILWSGSAENVPAGWALCDGSNGTPNLQGKFVVGNGTYSEDGKNYIYSVGGTGGDLYNHYHGLGTYVSNNGAFISKSAYSVNVPKGALGTGWNGSNGGSANNQAVPTVNIILTTSLGIADKDTSSSNQYDKRPPYYVLCYIMKK